MKAVVDWLLRRENWTGIAHGVIGNVVFATVLAVGAMVWSYVQGLSGPWVAITGVTALGAVLWVMRQLFELSHSRAAAHGIATAVTAATTERLMIVRGHLNAHIQNVNNVTDQVEMTAWVAGAEDMVRGMVPSFFNKLFRGWPQQHANSPDLSPQDLIALEKSASSLKVIVATIKVSDLPQ